MGDYSSKESTSEVILRSPLASIERATWSIEGQIMRGGRTVPSNHVGQLVEGHHFEKAQPHVVAIEGPK